MLYRAKVRVQAFARSLVRLWPQCILLSIYVIRDRSKRYNLTTDGTYVRI